MYDFREFLDWGNWSVKYEMTDTHTERKESLFGHSLMEIDQY